MRFSTVAATTSPVKRGEVSVAFTVDSLESSISAMRGVPVKHGHDPISMPVGKIENAWVQRHSDTEASLHQAVYMFSDKPETFIHELSKTRCVHLPFKDSPKRFAREATPKGRAVTVDISAIAKGEHDSLIQEVLEHDENIDLSFHDRQEDWPIALIRFFSETGLAETLVLTLKLALVEAALRGRLARWAESTVTWLKNDCIPVLNAYRKRKAPAAIEKSDEWIVLTFDGRPAKGPLIELAIKSDHSTEMPLSAIQEFAETISKYSDLLANCDNIVFGYFPEQESCEFRYALTKQGGVIATEKSFQEALDPHLDWLAQREHQNGVFWTLVTQDTGELVMHLITIDGSEHKSIGYLSMPATTASKFRQLFQVDDGVLRPFNLIQGDTNTPRS